MFTSINATYSLNEKLERQTDPDIQVDILGTPFFGTKIHLVDHPARILEYIRLLKRKGPVCSQDQKAAYIRPQTRSCTQRNILPEFIKSKFCTRQVFVFVREPYITRIGK